MHLGSIVGSAGAVVLLATTVVAPGVRAHEGGTFCESSFANVAEGPLRQSDQTYAGHGEGSCASSFQGFPLGVIGRYEAISLTTGEVDTTAPAAVHVEVWLRLANGTRRKYAECEDGNPILSGARYGTAECSFESSGETGPVSTPEPLPREVVDVQCLAHAHARVKEGTAPVARFGCYSTDEAEAALRADMGIPARDEGAGDEGDGSPIATGDRQGLLPGLLTSIPSNTYLPSRIAVTSGTALRYENLDLGVWHDVVALDATRADGAAPWCSDLRFAGDPCPAFASDLIKGDVGATSPVRGLEALGPGDYRFYCTLHQDMVGTMTVLA